MHLSKSKIYQKKVQNIIGNLNILNFYLVLVFFASSFTEKIIHVSFTYEILQTCEDKLIPVLHRFFQKRDKLETLCILFNTSSEILIPKFCKHYK